MGQDFLEFCGAFSCGQRAAGFVTSTDALIVFTKAIDNDPETNSTATRFYCRLVPMAHIPANDASDFDFDCDY